MRLQRLFICAAAGSFVLWGMVVTAWVQTNRAPCSVPVRIAGEPWRFVSLGGSLALDNDPQFKALYKRQGGDVAAYYVDAATWLAAEERRISDATARMNRRRAARQAGRPPDDPPQGGWPQRRPPPVWPELRLPLTTTSTSFTTAPSPH